MGIAPYALAQAAEDAVCIPLRYARQGRNLVHVAMGGRQVCVDLRHYPERDVVDAQAGTRFYYHAHASHKRPAAEHGHFHLFAHRDSPGDFMHLAALSLDAQGMPLRWFTTNRWVTGEPGHRARDVIDALQRFEVRAQGRYGPLARWLTAMVRLFRPQLEQLVVRRDRMLERRAVALGMDDVGEDRRLDVVSQCDARLPARVELFQQRGR